MTTVCRAIIGNDRSAPVGKYRVLLNIHDNQPGLYIVADCDFAEEAINLAKTIRGKARNGIVHISSGFALYPTFDGHQLCTPEELLQRYGRRSKVGERGLTAQNVAEIEAKQEERIPGWKPGHQMVVFWKDISDATGARAYAGYF
jgi:hypothetical protein